jgi:hypothetical protein
MEATFKRRPLHNLHVTFDLAPAGGDVDRTSLPLSILTGKAAAELGRETRLNTPLVRQRLGRNLLYSLRFEKSADFV